MSLQTADEATQLNTASRIVSNNYSSADFYRFLNKIVIVCTKAAVTLPITIPSGFVPASTVYSGFVPASTVYLPAYKHSGAFDFMLITYGTKIAKYLDESNSSAVCFTGHWLAS